MGAQIDVVFDMPSDHRFFRATLDAVAEAAGAEGGDVDVSVVRTVDVADAWSAAPPAAAVIGPGTPYTHPAAAEEAIRTARERGVPLVAT